MKVVRIYEIAYDMILDIQQEIIPVLRTETGAPDYRMGRKGTVLPGIGSKKLFCQTTKMQTGHKTAQPPPIMEAAVGICERAVPGFTRFPGGAEAAAVAAFCKMTSQTALFAT